MTSMYKYSHKYKNTMKTDNIQAKTIHNRAQQILNPVFCGYASVFNVVDNQNDVVVPNAIKNIDSIKNIPILWQHDVKKPVGKVIDAYIDDIGLFIYAEINTELIYGKEAYSSLKSNTINGLSIGYKINKNNIANKIGYLEDIKIVEISIVSLPANEMSMAELL